MAQVYVYDQDKKIIGEAIDSKQCILDSLFELLKKKSEGKRSIDLVIEECFDSTNTYYNIHFVPNKLRITKVEGE